ncbi:MAG: hypothetical protein EA401_06965 [Planctomycetota bacterium]|nr:MAG: hypothetical protein EA401_06965 [Planctomycetota bacterium]
MGDKGDQSLRFGVCYYPDQWPEERWLSDMQAMRKMGCTFFRWLEGSWTLIEPSEGRYDFTLVDRVLDCAADNGLQVMLGTPTYAAPSWLVESYPQAVAQREDGTPWYHGSRRCWDYTNADYRRCCRGVVEALAERYAHDTRICAWQVDNELWCHLGELWGAGVRQAFQEWLSQCYGSIDALNQAWGLVFWSRQMDGFEQVALPGPTPAYINHHQLADYRRFLADLGRSFLHEQVDILKRHGAQVPILHNCPFDPVDRKALLQGFDAYGHDHYPAFVPSAQRPAMGMNYGRFRAYAARLWVVEQQASQVGQTPYRRPVSAPGELALAALQSIAHGCNLLAWFRWRTFPAAQESNWGGLLPPWANDSRHLQEATSLVRSLQPHAERIAASVPQVSVARIAAFAQQVAATVEPWMAESIGSIEQGREALSALGLNENQIAASDLHNGYQVALLPYAVALQDDDITALEHFVRNGGCCVVGPLAGQRDSQLWQPTQHVPPGALAKLTGTRIDEATTMREEQRIHAIAGGPATSVGTWVEALAPVDEEVQVCARYASGWMAGRAAVTRRAYGAGMVVHVGCALSDSMLSWLWQHLPMPLPDQPIRVYASSAEVLVRESPRERLCFALNHGEGPVVFEVRRPMQDLITGEVLGGPFTLEARCWRILTEHIQVT